MWNNSVTSPHSSHGQKMQDLSSDNKALDLIYFWSCSTMHHHSHFLSTRFCSASLCPSSAPRIFPLPLSCSGRMVCWDPSISAQLIVLVFRWWSAELACFVLVGFQQPALRYRNNRNVPKVLTAKIVPLDKCLLQKTVQVLLVRFEEVSCSSHDSCQTRCCLTSRTATVSLATDADGRRGLFLRWGRSTWQAL